MTTKVVIGPCKKCLGKGFLFDYQLDKLAPVPICLRTDAYKPAVLRRVCPGCHGARTHAEIIGPLPDITTPQKRPNKKRVYKKRQDFLFVTRGSKFATKSLDLETLIKEAGPPS